MNRRSPWLAFAACALMRGTLLAQPATLPVEKPALTLSGAAKVAEAELQKRGLGADHFIANVYLVQSRPQANAHYFAQIYPVIPLFAETAATEGKKAKRLAFSIAMNGKVADVEDGGDRRSLRGPQTLESK